MRALHDFPGGIHPPEHKTLSSSAPLRSAGLPDRLILPLQQHIGHPAEAVVQVGDRVLAGQLIGRAQGLVSAAIHAPTSGHIEAIHPHLVAHPSGLPENCIVLIPDGTDTWRPRHPIERPLEADPERLRARIAESGIAGLGGAGFPTHAKLASTAGRRIHTLILNAAECEPYITADDALLRHRPEEVLRGLEILCWLERPAQVLIGIESNKPEALRALQTALQSHGWGREGEYAWPQVEIVPIPVKYPSGGEKQLIQILTGQEVPHGQLPIDIGVLCQNPGTVAAVYRAVCLDEPLISRITTVTGHGVRQQGNFDCLLGTPVRWMLERCEIEADLRRVVMGGPMMGFELPSLDVPVVKTTNCLLAANDRDFPDPPPEQNCIRCGFCAQACPASLLPQQLFWFARAQEFEKAELFNLFDCIECGACAYVCPSHIPLVQYYRYAKGEIRQQRIDLRKSDQARERFEARQARLEREKAEREAKRQARARASEEARAKRKATRSDSADSEAAAARTQDPP